VCDDKQNITLMVIVCTSKQFKLLNFTKQQGGVPKITKTETNMNSPFSTFKNPFLSLITQNKPFNHKSKLNKKHFQRA
jgi:hypothetical protein